MDVSAKTRDPWLDILRASAIAAVMIYHVTNRSPEPLPLIWMFAQHGRLGVDLFFVLSGWLIGGLYWREDARNGAVDVVRFWQRRWWRTIPAYFAALAISWLAVYVARGESFDWRYLVFIQNYSENIPFFSVSWSLCIEEHCYLLLPLCLRVLPRERLTPAMLFGSMVAISVLGRAMLVERALLHTGFGYIKTASHLRWEGLGLGFWASEIARGNPKRWAALRKLIGWGWLPLLLIAALVEVGDDARNYVLGPTLVAVAFLAILVVGVDRPSWRLDRYKLAESMAVMSYSLYLTHALAIHVSRQVADRFEAHERLLVYLLVVPVVIGVFGCGFYFVVERTSLVLRERFVPGKTIEQQGVPIAKAA